jgi:UDP-N-acetylglucosamine--N-acetylmuramyl-(pentapeptide) pyrophosphoryl-undecaprenol N-acetylglucosamine transferase
LNAEPIVAAGGGLLVDDADLTPGWVLREVVPRVTDPGTLQRMSHGAARAGARDADVVLARHVLNVVAEHRRFAGGDR